MYIEHDKLTDEVRWQVSHDHDDVSTHKFTVKAKLRDFTQAIIGLTLKEAENLVEQLNFAIQDYLISKEESPAMENARDIVQEIRERQEVDA